MARITPTPYTHHKDRKGRLIRRRMLPVNMPEAPWKVGDQLVVAEPAIEVRTQAMGLRLAPDTFYAIPRPLREELSGFYKADIEAAASAMLKLRYVGASAIELKPGDIQTVPTGVCLEMDHVNRIGVISMHRILARQGLSLADGVVFLEPGDDTEVFLRVQNNNAKSTVSIVPGDIVGLYTLQHRFELNVTFVNTLIKKE